MKKYIWIFLFLLVFITGNIFSTEPAISSDTQDTKTRVLTRSMIFPGLGQISEKKIAKGIFFISGELFCIVNAFIANKKGNNYYWKYRFAVDKKDVIDFREMTEKYDKKRNTFLLAGVGVWIINMIDIFIHTKKKYPKEKALAIYPLIKHEKNQTVMGWVFLF